MTEALRIVVPVELDRDQLRRLLARMSESGYLYRYPRSVREIKRRMYDFVASNGALAEDDPEWESILPRDLEYIDQTAAKLLGRTFDETERST